MPCAPASSRHGGGAGCRCRRSSSRRCCISTTTSSTRSRSAGVRGPPIPCSPRSSAPDPRRRRAAAYARPRCEISRMNAAVILAGARWAMSACDTIPQQAPCASTTGTRRSCRCSSVWQQSPRSISGVTVTAGLDITSRTVIPAALFPRATARIAMSRSVITPTGRRWAWSATTGISPQSRSAIIRAASVNVLSGVQQAGFLVITSLTFMGSLLVPAYGDRGGMHRVGQPHGSASRGADVARGGRVSRPPLGVHRMTGGLPEAVGEDRLEEAGQRAVAGILDVGLGDRAVDGAVLLQDVRGGDAELTALVLEELLPERRVPEHVVLAVGGGHAALEIVVQLLLHDDAAL